MLTELVESGHLGVKQDGGFVIPAGDSAPLDRLPQPRVRPARPAPPRARAGPDGLDAATPDPEDPEPLTRPRRGAAMTRTTNHPARPPVHRRDLADRGRDAAFGSIDSHGGPIQDADPEEWAKQLRLVRRLGFTEVDPTDTWVRVGDLEPGAARRLLGRAERRRADHPGDLHLAPQRDGPRARRGVPRLQPPAARRRGRARASRWSASASSRPSPRRRQKALWFWLEDGWHDDESAEARARAASLIRELAEHAQSNGQQITLEMYEDTYVGTATARSPSCRRSATPACGLNPDIGNFIRLHRPLEPVHGDARQAAAVRQLLAREELPARRGPGDRAGDDLPACRWTSA